MTLDRSYDHHDDVLRRDRGERERGGGDGGREREFMLKREGGGGELEIFILLGL